MRCLVYTSFMSETFQVSRLLRLHRLQQLSDYPVRRYTLGLGLEVQNEPMAQSGIRHRVQVIHGQVVPSLQQRPHLTPDDQRLEPSGAGAIPDILPNGGRRLISIRMRGQDPRSRRNRGRVRLWVPPAPDGSSPPMMDRGPPDWRVPVRS